MSHIEVERRTYSVTHTAPLHTTFVQRTSVVPTGQSQTTTSRSSSSARPVDVPFTEGNYALVTSQGVNEVKTTRDQEKKELQDLNERFSSYLDRVRNLEAQNRKLADELEKLKAKWGKETSQIKAMYQAELDEARHTLDDAEKEKARLEIKMATLEEQIEEIRVKLTIQQAEVLFYKEKADRQTQLITDYEHEIQILRKQLEGLESEHKRDVETISRLELLLRSAREDLDVETLAHIDAENRRQTLEEAIEFLKSIHDQEMKELAALAYRDTSPESRDYWKNELAQAIREIEQMYAEKMEDMKRDTEANYNLKLQEMRTGAARQSMDTTKGKEDCKDLRNAVTDLRDKINDLDARNNQLAREIEALRREKEDRERELEAENASLRADMSGHRAELDAVMRELQVLLGTKLSLNLEIAAYRKLLEYEENRSGVKSAGADKPEPAPKEEEDAGSFGKGEMSAKTTYSRTAKGGIAITESPPHGRFVRLENTGKKEENISGYKLQRNVDNRLQPPFILDQRFSSVPPGQKITFWAKDTKPGNAPSQDIEIDENNWGIGSLVVTTLINTEGEERATLTQRTTYS
jgi:intermediate filament protein if